MADRGAVGGSRDRGKHLLEEGELEEQGFEEGEHVKGGWAEPAPQVPSAGESSGTQAKKRKRKKKPIDDDGRERKQVRTFVNVKIRHSWFTWFIQSPQDKENKTLYWTPGTSEGRCRFSAKLMELAQVTYTGIEIPGLPEWSDKVQASYAWWIGHAPYQ